MVNGTSVICYTLNNGNKFVTLWDTNSCEKLRRAFETCYVLPWTRFTLRRKKVSLYCTREWKHIPLSIVARRLKTLFALFSSHSAKEKFWFHEYRTRTYSIIFSLFFAFLGLFDIHFCLASHQLPFSNFTPTKNKLYKFDNMPYNDFKLGCRQAVRHRTLTPALEGSNPSSSVLKA